MEMLLTAVAPVFVKVTLCDGLVTPTPDWKERNVGETVITTPWPKRLTVCGLPTPLSVTVMLPLREPTAVGVKVTLIVQIAPPARLVPQLLVWAKSPLATMLVMLRGADARLVIVTIVGALVVLRDCDPKLTNEGERFTVVEGPVVVLPVPKRVIT